MIQRTHTAAELDGAMAQRTEEQVVRPRPAPAPSPALELKLAHARAAFGHMAPGDPRARLLQVAVLRRDEILLEALLRRLSSIERV
jgi:hypothetical protein